jgi:dolichyl-diphosphooligosaccharide--protein glycosyltransferase
MVNHFPQYNWFDPMTAFPEGKTIDWGPLFPFIAATLCIITGATSRDAIFFMSGWVAPLMATMMVPVIYYLGKRLWNRYAGLVSAGLIAIISLYYFTISSYGWTDHHVAEVVFSTVFILIYCSALNYTQKNPVDLNIFLSDRLFDRCRYSLLPCAAVIDYGHPDVTGRGDIHSCPVHSGLLPGK